MRRSYWFLTVALLLLAGTAMATPAKIPMKNLPIPNEMTAPNVTSWGSDNPHYMPGALDETIENPIGDRYQAGNTWYDMQHNATTGHMIAVDATGAVHMVWMRGDNQSLSQRHVRYNVWDPATYDFLFDPGNATGMQIDQAYKAGYATVAVTPGGYAIPAYHETQSSSSPPHAAAAMDWAPRTGAFTITQPGFCSEGGQELQLIWPKVAIGRDTNVVHMVAIESPYSTDNGHWQRIYYARGVPTWQFNEQTQTWNGVEVSWQDQPANLQPQCGQYWEVDTVMVIAPTIVASQFSDKVAIIWSKSRDDLNDDANRTQYNNDLYYRVSEDGGINWADEVNLTNFTGVDLDCVGTIPDTSICDRDTFRVYTDCDGLFDKNDNLHIAFTTTWYYEAQGTISGTFSDIWHWDESNNEFANIAHDVFDSLCWDPSVAPGAWQRNVQRPSFSLDTSSAAISGAGDIYVSFQWYDPYQASSDGFPMADAWVTKSIDGGRLWSEAVNVTQTNIIGEFECNRVGPDSCVGERAITLSPYASYSDGVGYLHMEYVIDRDAGTCIQTPAEGIVTLNPVFYQRIPLDSIPSTPYHDIYNPPLHYDSVGFPAAVTERPNVNRPNSFALYQNYPNPFNPTTEIQFDLPRDARVTLKVFNVMGQEVSTLIGHEALTAGAKTVSFDGSNLASGVYVYRLEVDGKVQSKKMVLMK